MNIKLENTSDILDLLDKLDGCGIVVENEETVVARLLDLGVPPPPNPDEKSKGSIEA